MYHRCFIIAAVLLFGAAVGSFAARPYHTDDPGTTEQGKFELELASDGWKNSLAPGLVFKHGITDRFELDIPIGYTVDPEDERGTACAQIYGKFALVPDRLAVTFTGALGDPSYAVNGIFSQSFGFLTVNTNLGGEFTGNTNDADLTYGLAAILSFGRIETGAEFDGTQESLDWWQVGAKCFFTDWCSFDLGIGGDFSKPVALKATSGLWFAFPVTKPSSKGN